MSQGKPKEPRIRRPPPTRWVHPKQTRQLRVCAYYEVLNEDQAFRDDLGALAECVAGGPPAGALVDPFVYEVILTHQFAQHWRLPFPEGARDVSAVIYNWNGMMNRKVPLRLYTPGWSMSMGMEGLPVPMDKDGRPLENPYLIRPVIPAPLLYLPQNEYHTEHGEPLSAQEWVEREAQRIADEAKRSILAQARELDQQMEAAGWIREHRTLSDPDNVRRMVRRVYLFAVRRCSYRQIADAEALESSTTDERAIGQSIKVWLPLLGISVPRPKRGRPARDTQ